MSLAIQIQKISTYDLTVKNQFNFKQIIQILQPVVIDYLSPSKALSYSVWDVFNNFLLIDATDRSKISSDQKRFFIALSLYPLSFFENTPFKGYHCEANMQCKLKIRPLNIFLFYRFGFAELTSTISKQNCGILSLFYLVSSQLNVCDEAQ